MALTRNETNESAQVACSKGCRVLTKLRPIALRLLFDFHCDKWESSFPKKRLVFYRCQREREIPC